MGVLRKSFSVFVIVLLLAGCATSESRFNSSFASAEQLLAEGNYAEARESIDNALELFPENDQALALQAQVKVEQEAATRLAEAGSAAQSSDFLGAISGLLLVSETSVQRPQAIEIAGQYLDSYLEAIASSQVVASAAQDVLTFVESNHEFALLEAAKLGQQGVHVDSTRFSQLANQAI